MGAVARKLPTNEQAAALLPPRWLREGNVTFEEFCDLIEDGQKADLIDGVIYMASPDSIDTGRLDHWLERLLGHFVEVKGLGEVFGSRIAYRIGLKRGPEPEISFVPTAQLQLHKRGYFECAPALVVEIVSPDSVHRDYVIKRGVYEEAGVREYWIIDPDEKRATFLVLSRGRFKKGKVVGHRWHSKVLPGLPLDVRWLWAADRPRVIDLLREVLD